MHELKRSVLLSAHWVMLIVRPSSAGWNGKVCSETTTFLWGWCTEASCRVHKPFFHSCTCWCAIEQLSHSLKTCLWCMLLSKQWKLPGQQVRYLTESSVWLPPQSGRANPASLFALQTYFSQGSRGKHDSEAFSSLIPPCNCNRQCLRLLQNCCSGLHVPPAFRAVLLCTDPSATG